MCRFGMVQQAEKEPKSVKKATGCLTNSPAIAEEVNVLWEGGRDRAAFQGASMARRAQVYHPKLCRAICQGLKVPKQMDARRLFTLGAAHYLTESQQKDARGNAEEFLDVESREKACDDVIGDLLGPDLAKKAREEKIEY